MIETDLYYIFAIITTAFFVGTYVLIRGIIWSIAFCDIKKGKKVKGKHDIRMSYLTDHVTTHKKPFAFWMKVKSVYIFVEIAVLAIYMLFPLTKIDLTLPFALNIIQSFLWFIAVASQYDLNRNTKYDRRHR